MLQALLIILTLLPLPSSADSQALADLKEIVIALKPDKNPEKMLEERKRLELELAKNLERPVKVVIPTSSAVILEGFANGTIDLGYLSSLDMVNAEKAKAGEILLVGNIKGRPNYDSIWLVKKDSKYQSLQDLKGKPVAFASRTSTSGYLIPVWDMVKSDLLKPKEDPAQFFGAGNAWYGSGYVTAVQRVLDGTAEAAAVSDYVYFGKKFLTDEQKAVLRVLKKQGPVPSHVIAVRSSLKPEGRKILKKALLALNSDSSFRDQVFTSELINPPAKDHLALTREALALTGIDMNVK